MDVEAYWTVLHLESSLCKKGIGQAIKHTRGSVQRFVKVEYQSCWLYAIEKVWFLFVLLVIPFKFKSNLSNLSRLKIPLAPK